MNVFTCCHILKKKRKACNLLTSFSETCNEFWHFLKETRNSCCHLLSQTQVMHVVTFSKWQGMNVKECMLSLSQKNKECMLSHSQRDKECILSSVVTYSKTPCCQPLSHFQEDMNACCHILKTRNACCHLLSGWGIRSLVFCTNHLILSAKEQKSKFALFKVWITVLALFNWSTRENHTCLSFLMSAGSKCYISLIAIRSLVLGIKRGKAWWKEQFWSESLLCKKCDSLLCKKSESLLKERITLS